MTAEALFEQVQELHEELVTVLPTLKVDDNNLTGVYLHRMCQGVADIADGYISLTKAGKPTPASVLIRPCVESVLKMAAVQKKPEVFLRIAYTESEGDRKFVDAAKAVKIEEASRMRWEKVRPQLAKYFPSAPTTDSEIGAGDLAGIAGIQSFYDFQYRLYCNQTHATFRTVSPEKANTLEADHFSMSHTLGMTLCIVSSLGGNCPKLKALMTKLKTTPTPPE